MVSSVRGGRLRTNDCLSDLSASLKLGSSGSSILGSRFWCRRAGRGGIDSMAIPESGSGLSTSAQLSFHTPSTSG